MYVCMCVCVYVCMYVWMDVWMDGWICVWMYVCVRWRPVLAAGRAIGRFSRTKGLGSAAADTLLAGYLSPTGPRLDCSHHSELAGVKWEAPGGLATGGRRPRSQRPSRVTSSASPGSGPRAPALVPSTPPAPCPSPRRPACSDGGVSAPATRCGGRGLEGRG